MTKVQSNIKGWVSARSVDGTLYMSWYDGGTENRASFTSDKAWRTIITLKEFDAFLPAHQERMKQYDPDDQIGRVEFHAVGPDEEKEIVAAGLAAREAMDQQEEEEEDEPAWYDDDPSQHDDGYFDTGYEARQAELIETMQEFYANEARDGAPPDEYD